MAGPSHLAHLFSLPESVQSLIAEHLSGEDLKAVRASSTSGCKFAGIAIGKLAISNSAPQLSLDRPGLLTRPGMLSRFPHVTYLQLTNCTNCDLLINAPFLHKLQTAVVSTLQPTSAGLLDVLGRQATRLQHLTLSSPSMVMQEIATFSSATQLQTLTITLNNYVSDPELSQLSKLASLHSLQLTLELRGDASSLRVLLHLTQLRVLIIHARGVKSDTKSTFSAALAQLTQLTKLSLDLDHVQSHDNSNPAGASRMNISWLPALTALVDLTLAGTYCLGRQATGIPPAGFTMLHRLQRLALHACGLARASFPLPAVEPLPLSSFTGLTALSRLEMSSPALVDTDTSPLRAMPALAALEIASTHDFGRLDVQQVLLLTGLTSLHLASYCGEPLDPSRLASLPHLSELCISNSTVAGWAWAAAATQLTYLRISPRSYCPFAQWLMTPDVHFLGQLRHIHATCLVPEPALRMLCTLPHLHTVTGVALDEITQPLGSCPQLTRLSFQPGKLFGAGSVSCLLPVLRALHCLQLHGESSAQAALVAALAECRRLQRLRVAASASLSGEAVCTVLAQLPDLAELELELWLGCWTAEGLRAAASLPGLRVLRLGVLGSLVGHEKLLHQVQATCRPGLRVQLGNSRIADEL